MVVKVVAHALFDLSNSSSDDFEILADDADTEESDAPTDPELGPADYWTCIKCKNQKNTPYYRYCEKCFQVATCFCISRQYRFERICINYSQCTRTRLDLHVTLKVILVFVAVQFGHVTQ